jgi:hypothetical protein
MRVSPFADPESVRDVPEEPRSGIGEPGREHHEDAPVPEPSGIVRGWSPPRATFNLASRLMYSAVGFVAFYLLLLVMIDCRQGRPDTTSRAWARVEPFGSVAVLFVGWVFGRGRRTRRIEE